MNPEIKAQWVKALRSGEYEQGLGYLNKGGKFCCLGVLSDLAEKAGVVSSKPCSNENSGHLTYKGEGDEWSSDSFPPASVQQWAGLTAADPVVTDDAAGTTHRLSTFNDTARYDFNKIADLIEANL